MVYHYTKIASALLLLLCERTDQIVAHKERGGTFRYRPSFSSSPCRERKPVLHARVRTVSDFHATVLVVADAIGGCNGRAAFAELALGSFGSTAVRVVKDDESADRYFLRAAGGGSMVEFTMVGGATQDFASAVAEAAAGFAAGDESGDETGHDSLSVDSLKPEQ